MKKNLRRILSLSLALTMILSFGLSALANNINDFSGTYILTEIVPNDAIEYAKSTVFGISNDVSNDKKLFLCQPFKLNNTNVDLYYFIVMDEYGPVGIYRVYEQDGVYEGIYMEEPDFINAITYLSSITTVSSGAYIYAYGENDLYANIGGQSYDLLNQKKLQSKINMLNPFFAAETQIIKIDNYIQSYEPINLYSADQWNFLQLDLLETQGSLPWCSAYVTASIVRYKTGASLNSVSAYQIMKQIYPTTPENILAEMGLPINAVINYANTRGLYPYSTTTVNDFWAIAAQIDANRPIYMSGNNINNPSEAHAFVCRGYNTNGSNPFYFIWNPWYIKSETYERIYASNRYYVDAMGRGTFLINVLITNW